MVQFFRLTVYNTGITNNKLKQNTLIHDSVEICRCLNI